MVKTLLLIVLLVAIYIGYQLIDNFDPESVKGKNVVITGASTGLGEQLAYQYARLGANIVITARRDRRLKEVITKCKQDGNKDGKFHYISLDMLKTDSPKQLTEFAENALGGIDILVLNHVTFRHLYKWFETPKKFNCLREVMDVNFESYVNTATYAFPALRKSNGSIVVINSLSSKVAIPFYTAYSASKHALEGFFGSLREELIMSSIDVSITMCTLGYIDTGNVQKMLKEGFPKASTMTPQSASVTALDVVKGAAQRLHRVYTPYLGSKLMDIAYQFFPGAVGASMRYVMESEKSDVEE